MKQSLALVSLVVADYDAAIAFFVGKLGFELTEDSYQAEQDKRWVVVTPRGSAAGVLLARASDEIQRAAIGNQAAGRVWLFLETDDFWRDYERYRAAGVEFTRPPLEQDYGTVAVFRDLCGNQWDLIQRNR